MPLGCRLVKELERNQKGTTKFDKMYYDCVLKMKSTLLKPNQEKGTTYIKKDTTIMKCQ